MNNLDAVMKSDDDLVQIPCQADIFSPRTNPQGEAMEVTSRHSAHRRCSHTFSVKNCHPTLADPPTVKGGRGEREKELILQCLKKSVHRVPFFLSPFYGLRSLQSLPKDPVTAQERKCFPTDTSLRSPPLTITEALLHSPLEFCRSLSSSSSLEKD